MRTISYLIVTVVVNTFALLVADFLLPGFSMGGELADWLMAALILTGLNLILKPLIKLFLGPLIILTLGVAYLLVNWLVLYILDILSHNLTIAPEGYVWTMLYASLIIGLANTLLGWAHRRDK
ncbi:MAG: phage holin family protein [Anaplasmataceae bacterium]|nr:phage holin family protein [Anaplasmataceae bacterium]